MRLHLPLPPLYNTLDNAKTIRISALFQPLPFPAGILQDHMRVAMIDDSFVPGKCLHVQGVGSIPRRTGRNLLERRNSGMTG